MGGGGRELRLKIRRRWQGFERPVGTKIGESCHVGGARECLMMIRSLKDDEVLKDDERDGPP